MAGTTDRQMFLEAVRAAWAASTSVDPAGWDSRNPAWGQCAVTALVLQDEFGGELLRGLVNGVSHYFNRLPDGTDIDLTREQFGSGPIEVCDMSVRERSYVLSYPETRRRYHRFKSAVESRVPRLQGRPQAPANAALVGDLAVASR
jgi:hypothetical protein